MLGRRGGSEVELFKGDNGQGVKNRNDREEEKGC